MVIEVLSPANADAEMIEKETICLESGAAEFRLVDPDRKQVRIETPDDHSITYKASQQIPLLFGGTLPIDVIFA